MSLILWSHISVQTHHRTAGLNPIILYQAIWSNVFYPAPGLVLLLLMYPFWHLKPQEG